MPRSAGGLRDAACSAANPPQETPIIPTAPVHQGCSASQAIDLVDVARLLRGVLVLDHAVGVAAAAQVDPHARVAVAGEVAVPGGVARRGAVALAVGDGVQDRGHGIALGVLGQPDARGEPAAVGQRDPQVLDGPDRAREVGSDLHRMVDAVEEARVFSHIRHAKGSFTE